MLEQEIGITKVRVAQKIHLWLCGACSGSFLFKMLFYFLSIEIKNEKKKTNAFDGLKQKAKNVFGVNNTIFYASRILL